MTWLFQLIGLSMLITATVQMSTPDSPTYVAGVVEYLVNQGNSSMTSTEQYQRNADKYIEIMHLPEAANVDIIVFPESCLNSYLTAVIVPNEHEEVCTNELYEQNLRNISCAARDLKKYVVINLTMKRDCLEEHAAHHDEENHDEPECPNEWLYYNTNVVFDRDGKVISLYRKYNLFGEFSITRPSSVDISTFSTDFGVTFGHFICFDLMFQSPALDLIAQGIKDIIFPTMWFSEIPFLSAVQIQQNWAQSNDVNFLGAGANRPIRGSGGSGIYSGKSGALISIMTGEETTRLLVHEVPKIPGNPVEQITPAYSGLNFDNLKLKRDQLDVYNFKEIEIPETSATRLNHSFPLCQKFEEDEICCDFEINVALRSVSENSVSYTYFAGVFNGVRTFDGFADGNMITCAVIACQNNNISTCGVRYNSNETVENNISFQSIVIKGTFPTKDVFILPNSLNFNISPYPTTDFTYQETANQEFDNLVDTRNITMSLLVPKDDLMTFAIYGRDFRSKSSGIKIISNLMILFTALAVKMCIF